MEDEVELEYSKLCQFIERDGRAVEINIYRGSDETEGWILEIVDDSTGSSIVWDELFETDDAAFQFLFKEIEVQGLDGVIDDAPEAKLPS